MSNTFPAVVKVDPAPFKIYEDAEGAHYVLVKQQVPSVWMAMRVKPAISLVLLSQLNLERMHFIGRATLKA